YAEKMPPDLRSFIVNAPGENAYPISGFTYILVYRDQADADKGKALAEFLWWAVHGGQQYGPALHYAPLPSDVVSRGEEQLRSIRVDERPVRQRPRPIQQVVPGARRRTAPRRYRVMEPPRRLLRRATPVRRATERTVRSTPGRRSSQKGSSLG